jgi:hypothetical protein
LLHDHARSRGHALMLREINDTIDQEQPTHVLSPAWQGKGEGDMRGPAASEWFRPNAGRPKQQNGGFACCNVRKI